MKVKCLFVLKVYLFAGVSSLLFMDYPKSSKMGGSIHCTESIAYSMKELGASIEVIKILKEGYSCLSRDYLGNIEKRIITE